MIGQTLGHYRILVKVAAGGMGVVYRARDELLDRDVALKVLPAGTLSDDTARRHFRKEALTLAKLNHPNIETAYERNAPGERGGCPGNANCRGVGRGARARHRASRPEARKYRHYCEGPGEDIGFWFGDAAAASGRRDDPDLNRLASGSRHTAVHAAGAAPRRAGGCARRYLYNWRCALRDGHRTEGIPGRANFAAHRCDPSPTAGRPARI